MSQRSNSDISKFYFQQLPTYEIEPLHHKIMNYTTETIQDFVNKLETNDEISQKYYSLSHFVEEHTHQYFTTPLLRLLEQNKNRKRDVIRKLEFILSICQFIHPGFQFHQLFTDQCGALINLRLFKLEWNQLDDLREQIYKCIFNRMYLQFGRWSLSNELSAEHGYKPFTQYNLHPPSFCYFIIELNVRYLHNKYDCGQPYKYFMFCIYRYDDELVIKPILNYLMEQFRPCIGQYQIDEIFHRISFKKFDALMKVLFNTFMNNMDDLSKMDIRPDLHEKLGINFKQIEEDTTIDDNDI